MMTKTAHNAGPNRPEADAMAGTDFAMTNGTTHVGTAGNSHPTCGDLRQ
jgi:hypothetical protein